MNSPEVGLIVLGSQDERHGLLPTDTDTKLALHVAFVASKKTGARIVGVMNSAAEHDYLEHGRHQPVAAVLTDLKRIIENAKDRLGIERFILVNGHGGNKLLKKHLPELEKTLDVRISFNNSLIEVEGGHAATEECSMAAASGLAEKSILKNQGDFKRYPEVGFVGMTRSHQNKRIKEMSQKIRREGVYVDVDLGRRLLDKAVSGLVEEINSVKIRM